MRKEAEETLDDESIERNLLSLDVHLKCHMHTLVFRVDLTREILLRIG